MYGYSAWDGEEGIVTLRNPLDRVQSFSVTLDRQIGVGEGAGDMSCVVWLPYSPEPMHKLWQYGDTLQVELQPHAVRLLCFGKPETTAPVLRRARMTDQNTVRLTFDKLVIDLDSYELIVDGKKIDTPPKELELLYHLASTPNRVYTRNQLLDEVWGFDYFGDSRTVDVHIKRLREKIEDVSDQWALKTVWGVGYKFELKGAPSGKES